MEKKIENKPAEKIKVYELDFGDTNLITKNIQEIIDWIHADVEGMGDSDELSYTITTKLISEEEFENLPEWS